MSTEAGRSGTRGTGTLNYPSRMRRLLQPTVTLALCCLLCAVAVPAARAATGTNPVIVDCEQHNYVLQGHYTLAELQRAYDSVPAQLREYTTCAQVIQSAITALLAGHHVHGNTGGSSGGGSGLTIVIVAVVVIVLAGGGVAVFAGRKRSSAGGGPQAPTGGS